MLTVKAEKKDNKFQAALDYLVEYRGVREAAILDRDGLLVGYCGAGFSGAEAFAPLSLLMLHNIDAVLERLGENKAGSVVVKTVDSWLTIQAAANLILVVRASSEADDLLRVRIGRAADMIRLHVQEKYPLQVD